jgi:hypothetical protein
MTRSLILAAVFAAGGLGGWLASQCRGPQAMAQPPAEPKPAEPKAADPKAANPKPPEPGKGPEAAEHPLDTLDWLVGDWADADEKQSVEFTCAYTKNRAFLTRAFRVIEGEVVKLSGMQIIGWDESLGTIRSWTYDSDGGFGAEIWSQTGARYTLRSTYTLPSGLKGSALSTLTHVTDDKFLWKSVNREIGGEFQPDIDEFVIVRKSRHEQPKKEDPKPEEPKKEGK